MNSITFVTNINKSFNETNEAKGPMIHEKYNMGRHGWFPLVKLCANRP